MHSDAKYENLQTTNFYAKNITAQQITLEDTIIKSDIMMAGGTVKKLYEAQPNTNVFDDSSKEKLDSLNKSVPRNTQNIQMFKLPFLSEFDVSTLPNYHSVMCFDDTGNVVYVCNYNDTIRHYTLPVYEPKLNFSLNITNDKPLVKLDVI